MLTAGRWRGRSTFGTTVSRLDVRSSVCNQQLPLGPVSSDCPYLTPDMHGRSLGLASVVTSCPLAGSDNQRGRRVSLDTNVALPRNLLCVGMIELSLERAFWPVVAPSSCAAVTGCFLVPHAFFFAHAAARVKSRWWEDGGGVAVIQASTVPRLSRSRDGPRFQDPVSQTLECRRNRRLGNAKWHLAVRSVRDRPRFRNGP